MGNDDHIANCAQQNQNETDATKPSSSTARLLEIDKDLVKINAIIELFCRKLGDVLPGISLEIFHTYQRATETLDSLTSKTPPGLVFVTVDTLSQIINDTISILNDRQTPSNQQLQDICMPSDGVYLALTQIHDAMKQISTLAYEADIKHILSPEPESFNKTLDSVENIIKTMDLNCVNIESSKNDCMTLINDTGIQGAQDLENTFKTVIMIFKDLIDRSNATKDPFLTIMTSLQVHDIVRQDIENILFTLKCLLRKKDDGMTSAEECSTFEQKACNLSAELLDTISQIIHEHAKLIGKEINIIQDVVSGVKSDKDHLSEFLLENEEHESTLDSAISETTLIFDSIIGSLQEYCLTQEQLLGLIPKINKHIADVENIHEYISGAIQAPVFKELHPTEQMKKLLGSISDALFSIKSVVPLEKLAADEFQGIPMHINAMHKAKADIIDDLRKIKKLIIESVDGINNYSNRCMGAIKRFKRRMDRLYNNMQAINGITQKIKNLPLYGECSKTNTNENSKHYADINDEEMMRFLELLSRPHTDTLTHKKAELDEENDEGDLTFF